MKVLHIERMTNLAQGLVVAAVHGGSIAEEMEIECGDQILSIDGQEIKDIIDFQYLTAEDEFTLLLEKADGELWEIEIERSYGEELGLEVQAVSPHGLKLCKNNCVFCFVAQMPKGMRGSLYDKDDDYRLSLTQGSFITLSNLDDDEFERILKFHLSPLYISVHAWDSETRVRLMKNPKAGDLSCQLKRLAEAGIHIHSQIVLVPGYNDGEILEQTVRELGNLHPSVQSIAVVPVGLTKYRVNLPDLRPFTPEEARDILTKGESWQREYRRQTGRSLVYFSDEFYASAGWDYPATEIYDDFAQLENGVGMASKFRQEFDHALKHLPAAVPKRKVHLITGVSAVPFFDHLIKKLSHIEGLTIELHTIINNFFGPTVTVAGLLTAQDIARHIGNIKGEIFLIPRVMLKADEEVFLDDRSLEWLAGELQGVPLVVENQGRAFLEAVTGLDLEGEDCE
ncbi:radical SAM protein [Desulfitobacterium sp. PCE1]|uniref:radical SAM protein n=1 Tax=Desulfitobacterium sp. PCE1 TaxID=146907 RepID=UPI00035D1EF9|nr:radical SAM protein [Desulfitobacterium sp. PCE1]